MALVQTLTINGRDSRRYKFTAERIEFRGMGPVRRSATAVAERPGRFGNVAYPDEQLMRISGYIHDVDRGAFRGSVQTLARDLAVGQDGRRTIRIKLEDSDTELGCQYAGDFQVDEISASWYVNRYAKISFSVYITEGGGLDKTKSYAFTSIGDKVCKPINNTESSYAIRPRVILKNNNASAITALTLINYAKRRIRRKLTGTISGSFVPVAGKWGLGFQVTTGTQTYSFANSKLWPSGGAWTIIFRFKRVFGTGSNRTFWETTSGNNRLIYNNTSGNLELIMNNVLSASYNNAISTLSTSDFAEIACRNSIPIAGPFSSLQDIFVNGVIGNNAQNTPPSTDPGANLYFGSNQSGGARAEGIFDEILVYSRALYDEEILYHYNLDRKQTNLEDVCLYVDFEDGVDGVGHSNIETIFSSISLAQNDSLVLDCERQTAKKITNAYVVSDQLPAFSGEFQSLEQDYNGIQLLQTGGGSTSTDLTYVVEPREAM